MKAEKKQTAVEWLVEQLTPSIALQQKYIDELKEQAKQMEKEQIMDAAYEFTPRYMHDFIEEYYSETYKQD